MSETSWQADWRTDQVRDDKGEWVADTHERYLGLIAAAPDMLAALKQVLENEAGSTYGISRESLAIIDRAIAKAEGRGATGTKAKAVAPGETSR